MPELKIPDLRLWMLAASPPPLPPEEPAGP